MRLTRYIRRRRAARRAQVIGLCRFSYPALGGFKTEHDCRLELTCVDGSCVAVGT